MRTRSCRTRCSSPPSAGRRRTSSTSHETSFAFLDHQTTAATQSTGCPVFWPVGNEGWHPRGEEKAPYDQQPVEAVTMAEAALAALDVLGGEEYLAAFRRAYGWFHGRNSLQAAAYRCPLRRLLRRPSGLRRESQPGGRIDVRLLVDGNEQHGACNCTGQPPGCGCQRVKYNNCYNFLCPIAKSKSMIPRPCASEARSRPS